METKANYLLVGAFTIAGFVGMILFIIWFAKIQFDRQFAHYDIFFSDVTGLSVASDVRFAGLSVGKVLDMELSDAGDGSVRVRIEIDEDTPVRTDSEASLEPQGVTGVNNVSISAGSANAPLLRESSDQAVPVIKARLSVLQALTDQGPKIVERLGDVAKQLSELLGPENQKRVTTILDNVEQSSASLDKALADVANATGSISTAADAISGFGAQLSGLGTAAEKTLQTADTALTAVTRTAENADGLLKAGTRTATEIGDYVEGDLARLTVTLDETTGAVREALPGVVDQLETSLATADETMQVGKGALASAQQAFDGASRVIDTDVGPVVSDLRNTLASFDTAVSGVSNDLPEIAAQVRKAAESASAAFENLRSMTAGVNAPVQAFAREGLPQLTRTAIDMRGLIDNLNELVSVLRRNPSQLLSGPQKPEFRR